MIDYYAILEVDEEATLATIKKSFRVLAKKYHPDLNPEDEDAKEKFIKVNDAYNILSDEKARASYDSKRKASNYEQQNKAKDATQEQQKSQFKYNESESAKLDFENWDAQFQDFFGFDPRGKTVNKEKFKKKESKQKNNSAFDSFFGFKPPKK